MGFGKFRSPFLLHVLLSLLGGLSLGLGLGILLGLILCGSSGRLVGGQSPLCQLDADLVSAGLDDEIGRAHV